MDMTLRTGFMAAALVVAALGISAAPADAVTCAVGKTKVTVEPSTDAECGIAQPSYSGSEPILAEFFGDEYTLSFKSDELGKGDGAVDFSYTGITSGTWMIDNFASFDSVVLGIKKANEGLGGYYAFLLEDWEGTWAVFMNGNPADFSHLDVWYKPGDAPNPIPLPASALFLLSGIGGIGFLRARRRRAAEAA